MIFPMTVIASNLLRQDYESFHGIETKSALLEKIGATTSKFSMDRLTAAHGNNCTARIWIEEINHRDCYLPSKFNTICHPQAATPKLIASGFSFHEVKHNQGIHYARQVVSA